MSLTRTSEHLHKLRQAKTTVHVLHTQLIVVAL